jgi:hypothetical protein
MKHALSFALVFAVSLVAAALVIVPSCLGPFFETPPDWRRQRQALRQFSRETARKFGDRHGDKPVGQWPELDRLTFLNAQRILAEMGEP